MKIDTEYRNQVIKVGCTIEEKEEWKRIADSKDMTLSQYVRQKMTFDEEPVVFVFESNDLDYAIEKLGDMTRDFQLSLKGIKMSESVNNTDIMRLERQLNSILELYQTEFLKILKNRTSAEKYARRMVKEWKSKQKRGEQCANNEGS